MIPVGCLDFESTSVDPETARIVSAAFVLLDQAGQVHEGRHWLVNPGVPIPEGATAVHGITDDMVQAKGMPAAAAVADIAESLATFASNDYRQQVGGVVPLVIYNAPYDLTLLDREIRRHGVTPNVGDGWQGGIWWDVTPVVDPLVIDKTIDRYRKGKRTLTALAEHMSIPFEGEAHGATADALTTGRIAQRMLTHDTLRDHTLEQLHDAQVDWARTIATSLADYFHSIGAHDKALAVRGTWPYYVEGMDE